MASIITINEIIKKCVTPNLYYKLQKNAFNFNDDWIALFLKFLTHFTKSPAIDYVISYAAIPEPAVWMSVKINNQSKTFLTINPLMMSNFIFSNEEIDVIIYKRKTKKLCIINEIKEKNKMFDNNEAISINENLSKLIISTLILADHIYGHENDHLDYEHKGFATFLYKREFLMKEITSKITNIDNSIKNNFVNPKNLADYNFEIK